MNASVRGHISRLWRTARVREWVTTLHEGHVPDASSSVRHLLRHAVEETIGSHASATELLVNDDATETKSDATILTTLDALCQRRLSTREPVQYIVGSWDFLWLDNFLIRPPTLVPRPETEELVEKVLDCHLDSVAEITRTRPFHFLEVGCGSGVISIALLKAMQARCAESPSSRFPALATAIDCSDAAIALATDNATLFGVGDALQLRMCPIQHFEGGEGFDLIVSNPPYIPTAEVAGLMPEVAAWEDPGALDGGEDGLEVVRHILRAACDGCLSPGGEIFLEVATQHPSMIESELEQEGWPPLRFVSALNDFTDRPRFVRLQSTLL